MYAIVTNTNTNHSLVTTVSNGKRAARYCADTGFTMTLKKTDITPAFGDRNMYDDLALEAVCRDLCTH